MSYAGRYAGFGTQAAAFEEPPKDPVSTVPVVPMTPGLYTTPNTQTSSQSPLAPWLAPTPLAPSSGQSPLPSWRQQIQRMLEAATLMVVSLPGEIVTQILALLGAIVPAIRQEADEFQRYLVDPTKSDAQVAEKLRVVNDRYRSVRPSLPAPAIRLLDPILEGAIGLVPAEARPAGLPVSNQYDLGSVPWLWIAGSFVAGMVTCSFISRPKTTPNRRRVRRNRRRR